MKKIAIFNMSVVREERGIVTSTIPVDPSTMIRPQGT
jgi:hypothetical protein